ncbi:AAA family ATPase [Leptospira sarikeiensis]|uniref:Cytidyltransferase n=1 Tax=Leptospira sarikeiensis TaxID=2484943 RepID=A0A4V3JS49_9LEPT|nr:AAA family ATPase [Leptospira sarikeiensis]TGL63210.1 cytidyltransferase [Leptospira sarikeiensis]
MKKTGLVLGKFAPLHKGHMFLIETALHETDELIVLIYDSPNHISIPLDIRTGWIRRLFPAASIIESWDGPMEVGSGPEIEKQHEDYILKLLGDKKITHFFSGEFYGEHMSKALGAIDRRIDPDRLQFPTSGTEIRNNLFFNKQYLDPIVYSDFISNIVFLGAPSTGKTTICNALATEYDTVWMPEFGREYWEKNQIERRLTFEQLTEIALGHIEREDKLILKANRFIFTDTNALTTRIFSQDYHGKVSEELELLAESCVKRYDLVFLCEADIPFEDTWDRSGPVKREIFQKRIESDLRSKKIPYIRLTGNLEERIKKAKAILDKQIKFGNSFDLFS